MVANPLASRRRPWPYDCYIGPHRLMLVPDDEGNLVGRKTRTLDQSAPSTFEYGSANPFKERTFLWSKLYSGFGQATAPTLPETPWRYSYGTFVDTSINGYWMKGPRFSFETTAEIAPGTIAGAGEVRQLVSGLHGGVVTLFAVCQFGVWRRVPGVAGAPDTWTPSLTAGTTPALPVSVEPQVAVRFKGRHAGSVDALYLGVSSGNLWHYNGTAWAIATAGQGPTDPAVRYFERVGNELWAANDFVISKCEANPLVTADWSAAIVVGGQTTATWIGDQSSRITWLKAIDDTLFIFKEDGVYTVSVEGFDQELFPTMRGNRSVSNGRNAAVWLDQMWMPYGMRLYRLNQSGELAPDGIEQLLENMSEVRGQWVAGTGHNTWFFYELYYNPVSATTYLVKHGTWVDDGSGRSVEFLNTAHHGALYQWAKRATCAEVVPQIHPPGAPTHDRLYVGFADGSIEWCILPRTGPNPAADGGCEFTAKSSYVYLPTHHANFQADNKLYRGASLVGPRLTNTEWAEVAYRLDIANPTAAWITLDPTEPRYTVPGQRKDFPTDNPIYGRAIQLRIELKKNPSSSISPLNATPVLDGLAIHEQIRPSLSLEYVFHIDAGTFACRRNGSVIRRRGSDLKSALLSLMAGAGTVMIVLPDGMAEEMTLVDYSEGWLPSQKRRDLQFVISIQAIQLATLTQQPVSSGLSYGTLETYTYGGLEEIL